MADEGVRIDRDVMGLEAERISLLCHFEGLTRAGAKAKPEALERLALLQGKLQEARSEDPAWSQLIEKGAGPLECDALAFALAPEIDLQVARSLQQLSPNGAEIYASPLLIASLLALEGVEINQLTAAISRGGLLGRLNLIEVNSRPGLGAVHQQLRPTPLAEAIFLGRSEEIPPPPGTLPVTVIGGLEQVVLPGPQRQMLSELMLLIQQKEKVVGTWQARAMGGPICLFSGPSGVGKSAAAAAVAGELGWPIYRIDLGLLVSKYLGETEKNLNRLFDAARGRRLILLCDEADSLFGRRGEVKEARDRYANLEVSHLLSRIEAEDAPPCILTTNLRSALDTAFARRFHLVIEFSRPDPKAREKIWLQHLPPKAPREKGLDLKHVAEAISLSGGQIRNAAYFAAHLAAGGSGEIGLREIATAIWRELLKDSSHRQISDMGELARFVQGEGND